MTDSPQFNYNPATRELWQVGVDESHFVGGPNGGGGRQARLLAILLAGDPEGMTAREILAEFVDESERDVCWVRGIVHEFTKNCRGIFGKNAVAYLLGSNPYVLRVELVDGSRTPVAELTDRRALSQPAPERLPSVVPGDVDATRSDICDPSLALVGIVNDPGDVRDLLREAAELTGSQDVDGGRRVVERLLDLEQDPAWREVASAALVGLGALSIDVLARRVTPPMDSTDLLGEHERARLAGLVLAIDEHRNGARLALNEIARSSKSDHLKVLALEFLVDRGHRTRDIEELVADVGSRTSDYNCFERCAIMLDPDDPLSIRMHMVQRPRLEEEWWRDPEVVRSHAKWTLVRGASVGAALAYLGRSGALKEWGSAEMTAVLAGLPTEDVVKVILALDAGSASAIVTLAGWLAWPDAWWDACRLARHAQGISRQQLQDRLRQAILDASAQPTRSEVLRPLAAALRLLPGTGDTDVAIEQIERRISILDC